MITNFALHLPINLVSFGQVSVPILRKLHELGHEPSLFPIQLDLNGHNVPQDFANWLNGCLNKALKTHKRSVPIFKLWHLNGSFESFSNQQVLFTFYELDQPTQEELNIIRNQSKVLVSSQFTKNVLEDNGADNIEFIPLFFNPYDFKKIDKKYFDDDRITFKLVGKLEKRKHHLKIINAWAKKYGNNKKYFLDCAVFNQFMKPEDQMNLLNQALEGKRYSNIQFQNFIPLNAAYNDYLNSGDIVIGMSGGEGWGLPEFHSVAIGKHAIILNASSYKGWANADNSVLVKPSGKIEVYDGIFFQKGAPFNQGSIFTWDNDDFLNACDTAIEKVNKNRLNNEGLKLQEKFTLSNTVNAILNILNK
jgi:hypothetical protein